MKSKFFISILTVLMVAMVMTIYATTVFVNDERLRLIDDQIEQTTSTLIAAQLNKKILDDIDQIDSVLAEKLAFEPPNLFLIIYDKTGKVIYQNDLATTYNVIPPAVLGWNTIYKNSHRLRSLTLDLGHASQFLEVGLVLNRSDQIWAKSSVRLFGYIGLIFLIAAGISLFLTRYLLRFIRSVSSYLAYFTSHLSQLKQQDIRSFKTPFFSDFKELIDSVENLKKEIEKLVNNKALLFTQMNHELKTPLAILMNQLESFPASVKVLPAYDNIKIEIDYLSSIVQEFIELSAVENVPLEFLETDAIKIGDLTEQVVARLVGDSRGRIHCETHANFYVFAKASLVRQVLTNLISNAIKYSAYQIRITIKDFEWIIEDQGPGLPEKVKDRMGQPFNRVSQDKERGTGLGLAWVYTVSKKYGWGVKIESGSIGTKVTLVFSEDQNSEPTLLSS